MCLQPGSVCLISAEPELGLELPEDGLICSWLQLGEHWRVYGGGVGINGLAVGLDPNQAWIWVSLQTWMLPNSQWKESGFICSGMKGAAFRWLLEEELTGAATEPGSAGSAETTRWLRVSVKPREVKR